MRDSTWVIVKNAEMFGSYVKHFWILEVWENVGSWLVYANNVFLIAQPYFSTNIVKQNWCHVLFLAYKTFNRYNLSISRH